jgi:predicted N-acyltransferase
MADGGERLTVRIVDDLSTVPAAAWDECAGADNPFVCHAFLQALEESGSATRETGWLPQHVIIEDETKRILGAVPMYLKSHSYGEYIFDHGWASGYERAGGRYYPKLLAAVPFTPATGPRLLLHPDADPEIRATLIAAMVEIAKARKVSSLHVNFMPEAEWKELGDAGFVQRIGRQFHWENNGYKSFDDFLEALNSRKRKQIRRERRDSLEGGIEIETLTGDALKPAHWDVFFRFYMSTSDRKWGSAYLTREFFTLLHQRMADKVVLIMARKGARWIGGALNLLGSDTLFGRNWGCNGDYPFLHFEVCYYRALDFAIAHGLQRVEAGAQGQHKIQRGYLPSPIYSAHWIRDPGFERAVADFCAREQRAIENEMEELEEELSPFKREAE